ncbi:MAG: dTDP-4-dehydrorhamnose reductase [Planctomycetes bacterium]|nr:dTDP-4-dehydrorhamnose reductase [Planctomycetota bacterium]
MSGPARVLVTGAGGQLGRAVVAAARARGLATLATNHRELPVEDADACRAAIGRARPALVVHCAAWTDVDGCEADPDRADRINGHGTAYVAAACRAVDARLVAVSTDYVFAVGRAETAARRPLREDDPVAPASAYGRSKLLGEEAVRTDPPPIGFHVARTAWVFGPGGRNFPAAILARARRGEPLRVVDDQIGSPTLTVDLADALLDLGLSDAPSGTWHAANEGALSWHAFAVAICARAGLHVDIGRQTTAELGRPAPRPAWSVLDCSKLAALRGRRLPDWEDALQRYLEQPGDTP